MRARGIAVTLALCLAAISGCVDDGPDVASWGHVEWERAEYSVSDSNGLLLARVTVEYRLDAGFYYGTVVVSAGRGDGAASAQRDFVQSCLFIVDPRTGEVLQTTDANRTAFGWGLGRVMPNVPRLFLSALEDSCRDFIPLGPQWSLLTTPTFSGGWGEAVVAGSVDAMGWRLTVEGDCQASCLTQPGMNHMVVTMSGQGPGLLPANVTMGVEGVGLGIVMAMQSHEVGPGISVVAKGPLVGSMPAGVPVCGLSLCEEDVPARLSLQAGVAELEKSPEWLLFRQTNPGEVEPALVSVSSAPLSFSVESRIWFVFLRHEGGGQRFTLQGVFVDGNGTARVTDARPDDGLPFDLEAANWEDQTLLTLDEVLRSPQVQFGLNPSAIRRVGFISSHTQQNPDARGAYQVGLAVSNRTYGEMTYLISAKDGAVHGIVYRPAELLGGSLGSDAPKAVGDRLRSYGPDSEVQAKQAAGRMREASAGQPKAHVRPAR